jgi:glycosyltransferase involved in cell wall biosynthesis
MAPLRIVVVTNRFGDLGTHPQLSRLAIHLKKSGHDVRAVTLAPPGTISGMFAEAGIEMDVIDGSRRGSFPLIVGRLTAMFRRRRPDAVVAFLYGAVVPARVAARLAGVPAVISSIRNEYFGPSYKERLMAATDRLSTRTVANSQIVAESLARRGIASRERLVVIPNGIDTALFRASPETRGSTRSDLGVTVDEFLWVTIGRLTDQKDYPSLFRAFSAVLTNLPRTRLLVIGRGPLKAELEEQVRRLGLQDGISFLGFRADIPSLLAASDASVMASRWEGMPNVVIEALASELPVVGTDVGGMRELVDDGVDGYLVPPSRPDALASAMLKVMRVSSEERLEMGRKGRDIVRDRCDLQKVMSRWRTLIEELMPSRSAQ